MKTIYLTRHGQTLFNLQHKIQGFCDSPLTELGINQAKIAKEYFIREGIKLEEAHSSTSERAVDTLEILTELPFKTHKKLKEWNFGTFEGEGEHLNPPLPYNDFFVQFGGEDQLEVEKRLNEAITKIAAESSNEQILIVSHGGAIANFYRKWENYSQVRREGAIPNCSIFKYEYDDGIFVLKEIIRHDFSSIMPK
ncbi:histidine phosphatase family protein [Vagococcus fluvialis]|jgi:probable phosphoglycerate mutase|uniref:Histidine phosphatase family protein n=1 Tax=Vagococcus fluvialis TaxID=2738 RepID=A0A369ASU7_9ENTE|nr:histidine phosphatase family protein [Vagococcus fluvialis]MBO0488189.1 histidine phosphatase family protein [Vagococcus fluvialis]MDT2746138.1 histidine phosphatase family protein [Vagococcus fluvialis]MDT2782541.1 histidine phosphatase family protein [Vagococcus fluvialis]RCX12442.1 putative phosphoglycerate mutase [Vagococcus fluvialis]RSU00913.1 histidine phosphatase family protein [Vagococcus fluvialis]